MLQINMMAQFLTLNSNHKRLGMTSVLLAMAVLTGCSALGVDEALPDQRLIYKQQREAGVNLEIPPDLAGSTFNDALDIPATGSATFSQYSDTRAQQQPQVAVHCRLGAERQHPSRRGFQRHSGVHNGLVGDVRHQPLANLVHRQNGINQAGGNHAARHAVKLGVFGLLGQQKTTCIVDFSGFTP